jgi:glycosyltransferase involved in cell wall biosynthesis
MPINKSDNNLITRTIDSVRTQLYPDWELCISVDPSNEPGIGNLLDDYARQDTRIQVICRANGKGAINLN